MRYGAGMDFTLEALGLVIRERREAKVPKMTQEGLGTAAGYQSGAAVSISRVESGLMRPGPERLEGIAVALGVNADRLEADAERRTQELRKNPGQSQAGTRTVFAGERSKDRLKRIQQEVDHRTTLITELADAFNAAHDRARDDYLMRFVELAASIADAPQPDSAGLGDDDVSDPKSAAKHRIRSNSHGVASALAGGAGGAFAGAAVGGVGAYATFMAAVSFGTASTGTAIAGLSGVAATNAALALLGGGTLAAGGAGVAGGAAILVGVVAAPALLLAVGGLAWMAKRNRKQQQDLATKLDEADAEMADTQKGFDALVDILPRATKTLDYIALHAGHALKRWGSRLGPRPLHWNSMSPDDKKRYQEFIDISASQLAVVTINVQGLMVSRGEDRDVLIEFADEVLKQAQSTVESLV